MENVFGLEPWLLNLIAAVFLTYMMVLGGWIAAKAGRSPLWVLLLLIPYLNVVMVWLFAYVRWPFLEPPRDDGE